ncbi:MAG: glycosyltransferase family 9 protein [Phycisphaerales bacterium]|nr:glycosyltransferase family 9 protein [Phycisphaerales bacterium]
MSDEPRILIIRPSALGDVCRSVPVLASLRRAYPHATIDWLVQDSFIDAISAHPALNEAIPFPRKQLGRAMRRGNIPAVLAWLGALRHRRYDVVLDAQGLLRSGLIAWGTRAKTRVGYANAQEHAALFYTKKVDAPRERHAVDRMLMLVEALDLTPHRDMQLFTPLPDRRAVAEARGTDAPTPDRPDPIVLAPTSRWPGKRWPIERFVELARALLADSSRDILIVGGPSERDQCAPLLDLAREEPRVHNLVGATSVGRLMGEIERSSLVIACDSAPLHMAVGFGVPTIALFGPTDVSRVGPYQREHEVLQHLAPGDHYDHKDEPHGLAMMRRITSDEVIARARAALSL